MEKTFNNYRSIILGKILEFDGEDGKIVYDKGVIRFNRRNIKDFDENDNLQKGDVVSFRIKGSVFGNEVEQIAVSINVKTEYNTLRKKM